jgi:hypothetical protein
MEKVNLEIKERSVIKIEYSIIKHNIYEKYTINATSYYFFFNLMNTLFYYYILYTFLINIVLYLFHEYSLGDFQRI